MIRDQKPNENETLLSSLMVKFQLFILNYFGCQLTGKCPTPPGPEGSSGKQ